MYSRDIRPEVITPLIITPYIWFGVFLWIVTLALFLPAFTEEYENNDYTTLLIILPLLIIWVVGYVLYNYQIQKRDILNTLYTIDNDKIIISNTFLNSVKKTIYFSQVTGIKWVQSMQEKKYHVGRILIKSDWESLYETTLWNLRDYDDIYNHIDKNIRK